MLDLLKDVVSHTHTLGFLPIVKVTGDDKETKLDSMADDRSVIMYGEFNDPVLELKGVFGMPQLNKLKMHLDCPEYKEDATIAIVEAQRNGVTVPTGLHFENKGGDFKNDYRFMSTDIINEKLKTVKFRGVKWQVECEPSQVAIVRMKYQAAAHSEESVFQVTTKGTDLVFSFGDASTHEGSFVFHSGITGKLKHTMAWPVNQVLSILNLAGTATMKFSDEGALQITIDSGLAMYNYILPAQTK